MLERGDRIAVGGFNEPIVTKVRALLLPKPMNEIRDPEDKFQSVDKVIAAVGVKIVAPGLEGAVAGAPLIVVNSDEELESALKRIREEISEVRFSTDSQGIVVKADTLGSLEALVNFLRTQQVPVRVSDIGPVSKRDLIEATIVKKTKPEYAAIVGFNVKVTPEAEAEAKDRGIPIFTSNVIYHIVDDFKSWSAKLIEEITTKEFSSLIMPGEVRILPGCVFRKSSPPIFGVEVLGGRIKPGYQLMKENGEVLGSIMQIQDSGKNLHEAKRGDKIAISMKGDFMVGRQVQEGENLLVSIPDNDLFILREKYKDRLGEDELGIIDKIMRIKWKSSGF